MLLSAAPADLFVASEGTSTIGEYTTAGTTVNANFVQGVGSPVGMTSSGQNVYTVNDGAGDVFQFTTSNPNTNDISENGASGGGIAISGSDIFLSNDSPGDYDDTIMEIDTSGNTVNDSLITDNGEPLGLAISGSDLFVANNRANTISEYTTDGRTVNAALCSVPNPLAVAVSGSDLYVVNGTDSVYEFTTSGKKVTNSLISGLNDAEGIAVFGNYIFVSNDFQQISGNNGTIGEYTTSGAVVNADLISGLSDPQGIAIVGNGSSGGSETSLVSTLAGVNVPSAIVAGAKLSAKVPVIITNQGNAFKGSVSVNIYADTGTSLDGSQVLVTSLSKKLSLKSGKGAVVNFNIKSLPSSLPNGSYHLLAEVVDPSGNSSLAATTQTIQVAPAFIQPVVSVGAVSPSSIAVGKSASVPITITNQGNETASGIRITLNPSEDGSVPMADIILDSLQSGLKLPPGKSKTLKLHFKITSALPAGSYYPYVSVQLGGAATTGAGAAPFATV